MVLIAVNRFKFIKRECEKVSVPLRGLWFLSYTFKETNVDRLDSFPSPCGDYGSYPHPL